MHAFLTGSRVYGSPRQDSDIDLAVFIPEPDLQSNPDIRDSIAYANVNQTGVMGRAIVASLHFLFIRKDESLASVFWERVLKGEGLSSSMAEYKLREQVTRKRSAVGGRLRSPFVYGLTIKAWNARRDGTAVKTLKYDPSNEAFPKIK